LRALSAKRHAAVQGGTNALLRSIKAIAVSGPEKRALVVVRLLVALSVLLVEEDVAARSFLAVIWPC